MLLLEMGSKNTTYVTYSIWLILSAWKSCPCKSHACRHGFQISRQFSPYLYNTFTDNGDTTYCTLLYIHRLRNKNPHFTLCAGNRTIEASLYVALRAGTIAVFHQLCGLSQLKSGLKRWPLSAGYVLVYLRIKGVSQQI
jgi:hypothetical protein